MTYYVLSSFAYVYNFITFIILFHLCFCYMIIVGFVTTLAGSGAAAYAEVRLEYYFIQKTRYDLKLTTHYHIQYMIRPQYTI